MWSAYEQVVTLSPWPSYAARNRGRSRRHARHSNTFRSAGPERGDRKSYPVRTFGANRNIGSSAGGAMLVASNNIDAPEPRLATLRFPRTWSDGQVQPLCRVVHVGAQRAEPGTEPVALPVSGHSFSASHGDRQMATRTAPAARRGRAASGAMRPSPRGLRSTSAQRPMRGCRRGPSRRRDVLGSVGPTPVRPRWRASTTGSPRSTGLDFESLRAVSASSRCRYRCHPM